ncbi:zinc ribbon domain-containing protein [Defluviitalea phaphyphila]|uniref:zinc ribbon domain-containing protein n=1 Tax=Defluviitalea phaphyphila TaxID=1473580 RepID=UPI000730F9F9|nr:zinc ribbon domain-containing protein [Defluviitalea phaphyphila]
MSAKLSSEEQKLFQYLVLLGEEVHYKIRTKELSDPKLEEISKQICKIQGEIAEKNNNVIIEKEKGICPKCKQPLNEDTNFCNSCGLNINKFYEEEVKKCPVCEKIIEANAAFCNICGSKQ